VRIWVLTCLRGPGLPTSMYSCILGRVLSSCNNGGYWDLLVSARVYLKGQTFTVARADKVIKDHSVSHDRAICNSGRWDVVPIIRFCAVLQKFYVWRERWDRVLEDWNVHSFCFPKETDIIWLRTWRIPYHCLLPTAIWSWWRLIIVCPIKSLKICDQSSKEKLSIIQHVTAIQSSKE
jgi:hypothetical protein